MTTILFGALTAVIGYWFNELRHRREMGVKMIEIAVGILAGKPDDNKPLREWAVKVLAHYSTEVPLSEPAKGTLLDKPLPVTTTIFDAATGRYDLRGGGAVGASGELFQTPMPLRESARERDE